MTDKKVSSDNLKVEIVSSEINEGQGVRGVWGGKMEFIFSCLSYAVGLGNVWRYPYLCYKSGGGAFLIPFTVMLVVLGIPMLFLESAFGQYTASGPVTVWKISPLFEGIGWSMFLVTFFASIYYCMLVAWTVFYFFASFASDVPWRRCGEEWNTKNCVNVEKQIEINNCSNNNGFFSFRNNTCYWAPFTVGSNVSNASMESFNSSVKGQMFWQALSLNSSNETAQNLSDFLGNIVPVTPSDEYFHSKKENYLEARNTMKPVWQDFGITRSLIRENEELTATIWDNWVLSINYVLKMSEGFEDLGMPRWELALSLLFAWVIIVICMVRGVHSAGKAVYFTALFPYLILTILFVRGLMLEGSLEGLRYYFVPKWHLLKSSKVWGDAAIQIFFSLNPCWGGIIALSSYNRFRNNALIDSLIVSIGDGLTSIYAGMVIFSILGYMSYLMRLPVDEVVKSGAGLAFIAYPDIVTSFPLAPLWAVLFFFMLLTLGFGTMIAEVNCLHTSLLDKWPGLLRVGRIRPFITLCLIIAVMFVLGLPCATRGGVYVLQWLDNYAATYSVLLVGFLELVVIGWIYGIDRFVDDIEGMLEMRLSVGWKIMWKYVSPAFLLAILVFSLFEAKSSKYGDYTFPVVADILGGLLSIITILPIPIIAAYKIYSSPLPMPWYQRARELTKPDKSYGPRMGEKALDLTSDMRAYYESERTLTSQVTLPSSQTGVAVVKPLLEDVTH